MAAIIDQMSENRMKNRQKELIAILRGLFGSAGAANPAAAALKGALFVDPNKGAEIFTEDGAGATDANLMTPDVFIGAKALMGELSDTLKNGCLLMHPNVKARLEILDAISFKTVSPGLQSDLPFSIDTYRGIPIFTSVALVRAGTGNGGFVYDSYLITKGTVGYGEKPQQGDTTDVASLQYWRDRFLNTEIIFDRTRFLMGVNGTKWVGNPANVNDGPSRAELAAVANWQLVYQSANRVGAVCIRTNG